LEKLHRITLPYYNASPITKKVKKMRERKKEKSERAEKRETDLRDSDSEALKVHSYRLSSRDALKVSELALQKGWNQSDAIREMIKSY
jgi:hypothetical protein